MGKAIFKKLMIVLLLAYSASLIIKIATGNDYQWDFWIYYNSTRAEAAGLNPYDAKSLSQVAQSPIRHSFAYPPITLFLFRPFTKLDFNTASILFLFIKCALLISLIYLWKKNFLQQEGDVLFYFFCLLAFNGAIYIDIGAGNISTLEQLLLWLAFFFYLKRKPLLFSIFILLAAMFKLVPLLFLFLLLFTKEEKKYYYFFGASACFLVMQLMSYLAAPSLFEEFVRDTAGRADFERELMNPSTFAFLRDAFELLDTKMQIGVSYRIQWGLYLAIIAAIVGVTWRAYRALGSAKSNHDERVVIFLACLVYALILPRFKDYSYILLIPPFYFIFKKIDYMKVSLFVIIALLYTINPAHGILPFPGFDMAFTLFSRYHPLLMAYGIWGLYLYYIFVLSRRPFEPAHHASSQIVSTGKEYFLGQGLPAPCASGHSHL
jgi:hypothetical protein